MPSEKWTAAHPLVRLVRRRATEFEFFQLLHLTERIEPDAVDVGQTGPARDEALRLRPQLGLEFPAGDLTQAAWRENPLTTGQLELTTSFMGLYGTSSPLPAHFTESLLDENEDDVRVREFVDLFHHRLLALLYRVWKKYRYYVTFEYDGSDPISQIVRGLLGIGTRALDEQLTIHPVKMFRYAGLLVQRPRSANGLSGQLRDFFDGVPVEVAQCVGRWVWIDPGQRNMLGFNNCQLGVDTLLGEQIYDASGKFRVRVGPVGFDDYQRFLPGGQPMADLAQIVKFYCSDPFDYDIELVLKGDEVPDTPLGEHRVLGRLAWTSWLKSQPCEDKSVIFPPTVVAPGGRT